MQRWGIFRKLHQLIHWKDSQCKTCRHDQWYKGLLFVCSYFSLFEFLAEICNLFLREKGKGKSGQSNTKRTHLSLPVVWTSTCQSKLWVGEFKRDSTFLEAENRLRPSMKKCNKVWVLVYRDSLRDTQAEETVKVLDVSAIVHDVKVCTK